MATVIIHRCADFEAERQERTFNGLIQISLAAIGMLGLIDELASQLLKRLPIIRHARWLYWAWQVEKHYVMWAQLGSLPIYRDRDQGVLDAIWRGER